jgi:3-oxoacyl-[acyl-carrier protein] reductase|tara:strand:- start:1263 stop:2018 length:756 start_codon:yes stop_codon:yes gene_type:complete
MERLKNKVAVITGSSSGIGAGIANLFISEGADIVVNYLKSKNNAEMLLKNNESCSSKILLIQADVSDKKSLNHLIESTLDEFGRIDIWVNNAGADILTGDAASANTADKLERLIETDLKGTINACWSVSEIMKKQGHGVIVNMGWDLSIHGFKGLNPQIFAASKSAVLGFTRSFAKSVAPIIRVNMVSPGWIITAFAEKNIDGDFYQQRLKEIPLGRFGTPDDIAEAVVFLSSDESSYLVGESININGGLV